MLFCCAFNWYWMIYLFFHLQTLLVFLFVEFCTLVFLSFSRVSSYKMVNLPTWVCVQVFVPVLLYSSPQSSGTTISKTFLISSIFNFKSDFVVVDRLGDELISISHGLQFESSKISKPYISKQCLSLMITDWTLFSDIIIRLFICSKQLSAFYLPYTVSR